MNFIANFVNLDPNLAKYITVQLKSDELLHSYMYICPLLGGSDWDLCQMMSISNQIIRENSALLVSIATCCLWAITNIKFQYWQSLSEKKNPIQKQITELSTLMVLHGFVLNCFKFSSLKKKEKLQIHSAAWPFFVQNQAELLILYSSVLVLYIHFAYLWFIPDLSCYITCQS